MLGDYGARVIKIEPPGVGDAYRNLFRLRGTPDEVDYFWTLESRNKESLALDLRRPEAQAVLHRHEAFRCLGEIRRNKADQVSEVFRNFIDAGERVTAAEYAAALAMQSSCRTAFEDLLGPDELLLTPGAPGVAPPGVAATGDPAFNRIWTALGVPCLGFPAALDAAGMPLGLQWVGRAGGDRALLAAADGLCLLLGAPQRIPFND